MQHPNNVRFVACECLDSFACMNVPKFSEGIAGFRDRDMLISRIYTDAHNVSQVIRKLGNFGSRFNTPEHASRIARSVRLSGCAGRCWLRLTTRIDSGSVPYVFQEEVAVAVIRVNDEQEDEASTILQIITVISQSHISL